jgi:putative FmdB family regulatory protein
MPLYEYNCEEGCSHVTTIMRSSGMRDEPTACDVCGAPATRAFSTVARVWAPTRSGHQ